MGRQAKKHTPIYTYIYRHGCVESTIKKLAGSSKNRNRSGEQRRKYLSATHTHTQKRITTVVSSLQIKGVEHCVSREPLLFDCEPEAVVNVCVTPVSTALHHQYHHLLS